MYVANAYSAEYDYDSMKYESEYGAVVKEEHLELPCNAVQQPCVRKGGSLVGAVCSAALFVAPTPARALHVPSAMVCDDAWAAPAIHQVDAHEPFRYMLTTIDGKPPVVVEECMMPVQVQCLLPPGFDVALFAQVMFA